MTERTNRAGQQIGDYRLVHKVGGGSFGTVYLGEHRREHTRVAVKILQARLTRSQDLKAFINEARVMRMKHPHILPLLDFGVDEDDIPFLVMSYAPKGTLRDRHPKGTRLPLATVVSYITPLASALSYAHSLHLIHRDVKPENILLGPDGEIWLSDFGIMTVAQSTQAVAVAQGVEMGGTLPYMAPEQIQGKPRPASDQYALGVLAYEWLSGRRPFQGTAIEIMVQHAMTPPPPLREILPTLPREVEQVILTALAKDPKQRFPTVEAFASALRHASRQIESDRPKPFTRTVPPPLLRKTSLASIPWESDKFASKEEVPAAQSAPQPAQESVTIAQAINETRITNVKIRTSPTLSIESNLSSPASLISTHLGSQRPRVSRRAIILFASLALLVLFASAGGLSASRYISTIHQQATPTVRIAASPVATPTTTATTAYTTYVATNGMMFGFNAAHTHTNPYEQMLNPSNVSTLTTPRAYPVGSVITSSPTVVDGVIYIGSQDGNMSALDAATGNKKWAVPTGGSITSSPAVVNGVLYVGSTSGTMFALDDTTGTQKWTIHTGSYVTSSPAVVNGILYIGSYDSNIYALDAATGNKKWAIQTGAHVTSSPAVVNGTLYVGSFDGNVYALDAVTGNKKWVYAAKNHVTSSPTVVDGILYVGDLDGNIYALDAATGNKKWGYHTEDRVASSPAVVNSVLYIGSQDGNIYAFDAATGNKKWIFPTGGAITSSPLVANGVLYIGSNDNTIYALDATTGTKKWSYQITAPPIYSSPAVVNGVLYVGSQDGHVYAFHLPGRKP